MSPKRPPSFCAASFANLAIVLAAILFCVLVTLVAWPDFDDVASEALLPRLLLGAAGLLTLALLLWAVLRSQLWLERFTDDNSQLGALTLAQLSVEVRRLWLALSRAPAVGHRVCSPMSIVFSAQRPIVRDPYRRCGRLRSAEKGGGVGLQRLPWRLSQDKRARGGLDDIRQSASPFKLSSLSPRLILPVGHLGRLSRFVAARHRVAGRPRIVLLFGRPPRAMAFRIYLGGFFASSRWSCCFLRRQRLFAAPLLPGPPEQSLPFLSFRRLGGSDVRAARWFEAVRAFVQRFRSLITSSIPL